jgi:hypothetical protein
MGICMCLVLFVQSFFGGRMKIESRMGRWILEDFLISSSNTKRFLTVPAVFCFPLRLLLKISLQGCLFLCVIAAQASSQPWAKTVIISEVFPDPSPVVGLPDAEFIELRNLTNTSISLLGWKIRDQTNTANLPAQAQIEPYGFLILCNTSQTNKFSGYGQTIGVPGFPGLDNNGDVITLLNPQGTVEHQISYTLTWYKNPAKQQGGWSLEIINPEAACMDVLNNSSGSLNWKASADPSGGTPGRANSEENTKLNPALNSWIHAYFSHSDTLLLAADQSLNGSFLNNRLTQWSWTEYYHPVRRPIAPYLPKEVIFDAAYPDEIKIALDGHVDPDKIYKIRIPIIEGCGTKDYHDSILGGGSIIQELSAGTASHSNPVQIVINELLFNPDPPCEDFVELMNVGTQPVELGRISWFGRNTRGDMVVTGSIHRKRRLLYPYEPLAFSGNPQALLHRYHSRERDSSIHQVKNAILSTTDGANLPSMPNDKGTIGILLDQLNVIEEVYYEEKFHHAIISSAKGVSLERIRPQPKRISAGYWHSAASTSGFGTPGKTNSQFKSTGLADSLWGGGQSGSADGLKKPLFKMENKMLSPNLDGIKDYLEVLYECPDSGFIFDVSIFDAAGRPVHWLYKRKLAGVTGAITWNGIQDWNETKKVAPRGHYIVQIMYHHPSGIKGQWKQAFSILY